jgi:hypothetical protein
MERNLHKVFSPPVATPLNADKTAFLRVVFLYTASTPNIPSLIRTTLPSVLPLNQP